MKTSKVHRKSRPIPVGQDPGTPGAATGSTIYQLKVILTGIYPEIWRRLLVSGDTTLSTLHEILQAAMGWTNSHIHRFAAAGTSYADPRVEDGWDGLGAEDESFARLCEVAPWVGDRVAYEYDLGDRWEHEILVENILPLDPAFVPPICLNGEGACPPEDCGGVSGYSSLVHSIREPRHEEHKEKLEWVGGKYDPDAFDRKHVNRLLKRLHRATGSSDR